MGLIIWMYKRKARGIIRAMWRHYSQGKTKYPDVAESQICRDTIGTRYQIIKPLPRELEIISGSIKNVENFYQACVLVTRAETNISIGVDNELWVAICVAIATEVATLKGEAFPKNIEGRTNELIAFVYNIEKATL